MRWPLVNRSVILTTVCERELFAGYFGLDADGTQPECLQIIEVEVSEEEIDYGDDGVPRPPFTVTCPSCGNTIEWPHEWAIKSNVTKVLDQ